MSKKNKDGSHLLEDQDPHPYRVHLPGFVSKKEVGLGDVIKRTTYALGIKPCGRCARHAVTLNRWMVFTGRGSS